MHPSPELPSLLTGSLGLGLVALDTLPAAKSIMSRFTQRQTGYLQLSGDSDESRVGEGDLKALYRDEDGEATEESIKAFSDKWQRGAIAFLSAAGFCVSLALAVVTTLRGSGEEYFVEFWLHVGVWAFLIVQAVALFTEPLPTKRFALGQYAFWASILAITIPCIEIGLERYNGNTRASLNCVSTGLVAAQIATAFLNALFCVLLPRRPDVFWNGKVVDRQHTVSVLARFSFAWAEGLLRYTVRNKGLEIDDLPALPLVMRADNLRARFEHVRGPGSRKVWKAIIITHWRPIVLQLLLTFVACLLSFGPQTALYEILLSLEARGTDTWDLFQSWFWVVALGALMLLSSSIEAWLFWIIYSEIFVRIIEELSAVVFAKAMRQKDVKHTKRSKKAEQPSSSSAAADPTLSPTTESPPDNDEAEDEDENLKKSRQSIINLAAIDSRRIANFATFFYLIPSSILKMLIAFVFLTQLIGWKSLLSGLAVSVAVTPLNWYVSKKYTESQDMLMKARDQKTAIVTEALQGIRQIKFSALEGRWQKKIGEIRNTELRAQWLAFLYDICLIFIWILGPLMLSAVCLAVYAVLNGELTASVAFTAMSIFGSLEMSLSVLPEMISNGLEAKVSADRIDKYLDSPEKTPNTIPSDSISFEDASVAWPAAEQKGSEENRNDQAVEEQRFVLRNLNIRFPSQGLTVISGRTGTGKSLLLAAILGESDVLSGSIKVPVPHPLEDRYDHLATSKNWIIDSAIAYVAQIPWIENASIRDNIIFGLPYEPTRYQKVLFACALEKDLEMLPDGELTDIGANGVNLSGGQKWRVSFARALYSRAGILIMDDIFSALDAHTGRHVYEHALTGELGQGRTRILVTHHVALCLPRTDYSVLLANGSVKHAGKIDELRKTHSLEDILLEEQAAERADHVADGEDGDFLNDDETTTLQKVISNTSRRRSSAAPANTNGTANGNGTAKNDSSPKKFVQDEKRETGSVKLSVYKAYFKRGGSVPYWLLVLVAYTGGVCLLVGRSWWVNIWTSSAQTQTHPEQYLSLMNHVVNRISSVKSKDNDLFLYLGVYVGLSLTACVVGTFRYYLILSAAIRASRNLFANLTYAVLRAPLRWLDTVPLGRILNRFTADFNSIDSMLGYSLGFFAYKAFELLGIMVAGVLVSPMVIVCGLLLLILCLRYSATYLAGAREIKRLESNAKSPVFEQFGSSLTGLITIRAFTKTETYIGLMYAKINRHAQTMWNLWLFNRWLSLRMNFVGAIFATVTAALLVYVPGMTASLAGFALSFALQYNGAISMALRQYADIELQMNATERVVEYSDIEIENQDGADAPAAWPTEGRLEVRDLVVGYAPDLPAVLNGLSFTAEKNQRVGIVGRTGAGKSSLTLALFRFLQARQGSIYIDGIDVSKIKLHDLRSRLAIIPQDPVLFSGTVRSNLDPFDEYSDSELYDALQRVHLIPSSSEEEEDQNNQQPAESADKNKNIFTSLSSTISEGGLNLSQGQRQLLCLARAIASRPKIMVLDEATSAVDMETDALIQQSIRAEFGRNATTLLVIAHRLSTIADFDRILVMDAGKAAEFGSPRELMGIEGGVFRGLVENSGEKAVLEGIIFGEGNENK